MAEAQDVVDRGIEVLLESECSDTDRAAVAAVFEAVGIQANVRGAYIRESAAILPWLIIIGTGYASWTFVKAALQGAGDEADREGWRMLLRLVKALYEARSNSPAPEGTVSVQAEQPQVEIPLPPDLPELAYRRLWQIETASVRAASCARGSKQEVSASVRYRTIDLPWNGRLPGWLHSALSMVQVRVALAAYHAVATHVLCWQLLVWDVRGAGAVVYPCGDGLFETLGRAQACGPRGRAARRGDCTGRAGRDGRAGGAAGGRVWPGVAAGDGIDRGHPAGLVPGLASGARRDQPARTRHREETGLRPAGGAVGSGPARCAPGSRRQAHACLYPQAT